MRLDLYLKATGLVKRRSVAKTMCEAGRVALDGRRAKAGTAVRCGQQLVIDYGSRSIVVRVLRIPDGPTPKEDREGFYVLEKTVYQSPGARELRCFPDPQGQE